MAKGRKKQGKKKNIKNDARSSSLGALNGKRGPNPKRNATRVHNDTADNNLRTAVEADGKMEIVDMEPDGNCLFRALSDQLFRDHGQNHVQVRQDVCDFMEGHMEEFKMFLVLDDEDASEEDASDFNTYLKNMRQEGEWGGNLELVAAARMYRRDVRVFSASLAALSFSHGTEKVASGPELLLSYHDNDHYNSVRLTRPPTYTVPIRTFVKSECTGISSATERDADASIECSQEQSLDVDIPDEGVEETKVRDDIDTEDVVKTSKTKQKELPNNTQKKKDSPFATRQLTRHAKCPCNSGMKYKKCCYAKERLDLMVANTKLGSDCLARDVDNDVDGQFRILYL